MPKQQKQTAISNEEIIAALLQSGTIKEAAAAVGLSQRAMYERMSERDFRGEYENAKADIMRKAVFGINEKLSSAIDAVADIMNDKEINPAVRLQAAQTIINNAGKFAERLQKEEQSAAGKFRDPLDFSILG